jgi:glycosyltransferase involved in cell wall biosynthesis
VVGPECKVEGWAGRSQNRAMTVPLSILIPTKNEERNIRKCLESVAWAGEVYVVDSCSTDRTAEIARSLGAEVVAFSWDRKGPRKKNWALENLPWRYEWVLVVDADEEVTLTLRDEITAVVNHASAYAAFLVPYHYYFLGQLLRYGSPLWKLILFKHHLARFEQTVVPEVTGYDVELHEHPLVHGSIGRLRSPMIHHDVEDLHHHFQRHNIYSDWEALLRTRYRHRSLDGEIRPRLFGSAMERRRFLKRLFLGLPGKSWIYFFYSYVLRGGFLDGRAGFIYNVLKAFYWYQVGVKEYEIRLHETSEVQALMSKV